MLRDGWQITYLTGRVDLAVCVGCQTPKEVEKAERASAAAAKWRSMSKGRLIDGHSLRLLNQRATDLGDISTVDEYFDAFPLPHVGVYAMQVGSDCLVGWLPVRAELILDVAQMEDGDYPVVPIDALPALEARPCFAFITVTVTDWLGWQRCALDDAGAYQKAATARGRRRVRSRSR